VINLPSVAGDRTRPDYVVILEVYGRQTVLQDGDSHAYHLIETIPTDSTTVRGCWCFAG
jgi:hypothetical protein